MLRDPILASFLAIEDCDKRRKEYKKLGWIYVARNASFVDPVFKVGESSRPPFNRVEELSASTSVYRAFETVYFVHVSNRNVAEAQAHDALKKFRINPRKEFFQAPLPVVIKAVDRVAGIFPVPRGKTPRAGYIATTPAAAPDIVSSLWHGKPGCRCSGANQGFVRGVQEEDCD